jgi:hypothetical protein
MMQIWCARRRRRGAARLLAAVVLLALTGCASDRDETSDRSFADGQSAAPPSAARATWPVPDDVADRVAAAGLDLGPMGTAAHFHPQLRIVINDRAVPVAANIGVDPTTGAMSALHTHEGDGTVHIEADNAADEFTLGQLFVQWDVPLTETRIGDVRAAPGQRVELTSNGQTVRGKPALLKLEPDQQIVLELRGA